MEFTKMHGAGNDYIYFNCLENMIEDPENLSIKLSDRHFSIGGDGIVLICPSESADVRMRMFNADGSEGKMCGNAIRCVAKYIYDRGIARNEDINVETLSGIKKIHVFAENGKVTAATVNMGRAAGLTADEITIEEGKGKFLIGYPIEAADETWNITTVSMGNPHIVTFVPDVKSLDLIKIGPHFENSPLFPERINTEFVRVIDRTTLEMRVWERGSGETLACGTGACATVTAAVLNGYCDKDTDVTVKLIGGDLVIRYTDDAVFMTGNAVEAFTGNVEI
ncbi:diaminopimelate epimerase [Youngiibacter multivorans]|uniref:Diaminopimelate epimerase n=1 Tax=Youngiibacter multivorans TaxID=937251 RepID=A0ABS4G2V2_9CLOT|nr:diaminopimelate epimerase [Youngiibacter multivorans]MBP1918866.1 diaminopimelate epimerase [Youngiibacter multivorans]